MVLTDLAPSRTIQLRVASEDASGNVGRQRAVGRFVTSAPGVAEQTRADFRTGSLSGSASIAESGFGELTMRRSGTAGFTSQVLDARQKVTWDRANWLASKPSGTTLVVSVRTGSSARPDASWGGWKKLSGPGAGSARRDATCSTAS